MKTLLYFLLLLPALTVFGQKEVRTYYDQQKNHIQEKYFVSQDGETLMGEYKRFYENGKTMVSGNFENGVKSGVFTE